MSERPIRRGDVFWVEFAPGVSGEVSKTRPAVIVSNDIANRVMNRLQVVPVTSGADRVFPGEARIVINDVENKALANQVTTIAKQRLRGYLATLSDEQMLLVERAIRQQLALSM